MGWGLAADCFARSNPPHQLVLSARITDLYREVGTLLLAFAPLDFLLQPTLDPWSLFGFVVVGGAFFALSVAREIRRRLLASHSSEPETERGDRKELAAALTRAEAATKEAEREIATARSIAIRS